MQPFLSILAQPRSAFRDTIDNAVLLDPRIQWGTRPGRQCKAAEYALLFRPTTVSLFAQVGEVIE